MKSRTNGSFLRKSFLGCIKQLHSVKTLLWLLGGCTQWVKRLPTQHVSCFYVTFSTDHIIYSQIKAQLMNNEFQCFTVNFDSLSFIHTNSCTFSYNYVSVF